MQNNIKKNSIDKKEKKVLSKKMIIAIVIVLLIGIVASTVLVPYTPSTLPV